MKLDSGEDIDIYDVETLSEKAKAEALKKMKDMRAQGRSREFCPFTLEELQEIGPSGKPNDFVRSPKSILKLSS